MKKKNFITLMMSAVGGIIFALGMCMALLPEWGLFSQGVACGAAGLAVLLIDLLVWRRMEGKAPIRITLKALGTAAVGVLGALLLGVGMCLSMVFGNMVPGILVGLLGILLLLCLIPLVRGIC